MWCFTKILLAIFQFERFSKSVKNVWFQPLRSSFWINFYQVSSDFYTVTAIVRYWSSGLHPAQSATWCRHSWCFGRCTGVWYFDSRPLGWDQVCTYLHSVWSIVTTYAGCTWSSVSYWSGNKWFLFGYNEIFVGIYLGIFILLFIFWALSLGAPFFFLYGTVSGTSVGWKDLLKSLLVLVICWRKFSLCYYIKNLLGNIPLRAIFKVCKEWSVVELARIFFSIMGARKVY